MTETDQLALCTLLGRPDLFGTVEEEIREAAEAGAEAAARDAGADAGPAPASKIFSKVCNHTHLQEDGKRADTANTACQGAHDGAPDGL